MGLLKNELRKFYRDYAKRPKVVFIGYNTAFGSRMYGTLNDVPTEKCIETPVAENLMTGLAIGYALEGWKPVLCIERHDFLFNALDGIVNHIDKMSYITKGKVKLPIIIRAIVGDKSKLDVGVQHSMDYTKCLEEMLKHTPVICIRSQNDLIRVGKAVGETGSGAVVSVEKRDMFESRMRLRKGKDDTPKEQEYEVEWVEDEDEDEEDED